MGAVSEGRLGTLRAHDSIDEARLSGKYGWGSDVPVMVLERRRLTNVDDCGHWQVFLRES